MEWQPIETAPKDGSIIIIGAIETDTSIGFSCEGSWYKQTKFGLDDFEQAEGFYSSFAFDKMEATHWQPLPAKPEL